MNTPKFIQFLKENVELLTALFSSDSVVMASMVFEEFAFETYREMQTPNCPICTIASI